MRAWRAFIHCLAPAVKSGFALYAISKKYNTFVLDGCYLEEQPNRQVELHSVRTAQLTSIDGYLLSGSREICISTPSYIGQFTMVFLGTKDS